VRADHAREASRRAADAGGELTPEDQILHALIAGAPANLADAARLIAATPLLDRDYLEYWADALGLQERWRPLR
jgi:hypothetical protein